MRPEHFAHGIDDLPVSFIDRLDVGRKTARIEHRCFFFYDSKIAGLKVVHDHIKRLQKDVDLARIHLTEDRKWMFYVEHPVTGRVCDAGLQVCQDHPGADIARHGIRISFVRHRPSGNVFESCHAGSVFILHIVLLSGAFWCQQTRQAC